MIVKFPRVLFFVSAAFLSLSLPCSADDEEVALPDILGAVTKVFDASEEAYSERIAKLEEDEKQAADAEGKAWVKEQMRVESIRHLRLSMLLLEDLNILASKPSKLEASEAPKGMSRGDLKKLVSLKNDILEEEKQRISEAVAKGQDFHADNELAEDIYKNEIRLDRFFEKKARNFLKKKTTLRKALAAEYKKRKRNDKKIKEIKDETLEVEAAINEIHEYVVGFEIGKGFETVATAGGDPTITALQERLVKVIDERLVALRAEFSGLEPAEIREGKIGNLMVSSSNLGVMLDVSGSMTNFIPDLKEEISETFSDANYREVGNCALFGKWFYHTSSPVGVGKTAPWRCNQGMLRVEDLVVVCGVDALYWFCDLRDPIEYAAMRRLRKLLRRSGCSFYVKSTGNRPEREFAHLITDS